MATKKKDDAGYAPSMRLRGMKQEAIQYRTRTRIASCFAVAMFIRAMRAKDFIRSFVRFCTGNRGFRHKITIVTHF
jgi:hypothetical protein